MGHVQRRLIAFDLDGTLIDSRQDLADAANQLIVELGGRLLALGVVTSMVGDGAAALVERALAAAGLSGTGDTVSRFLAIYDERLLVNTVLYPGAAVLLSAARQMGRVAVLTNKPRLLSERILEALDVRSLIDDVVGGDGPHPRKPDPAGLVALMRVAGADPEATLLVGDSHVDRETAKRAGALCCVVTWGFGRPDLTTADGVWVVDSAEAALEVLRAFSTLRSEVG